MKPVIVSYFTRDTAYEAEAREMEATARTFGLFTDVRAVPNLGDWVANCAMKPPFIRDRMADHPGRPVVWLDADARVRAAPVLFEQMPGIDFSAHWRHGSELLSGTMYWGGTDGAKRLVEAWCDAQSRATDVWDQRVLASVIASGAVANLAVRGLPSEYARVFDDAKMGEPVILHTQASRRLKNDLRPPAHLQPVRVPDGSAGCIGAADIP